MILLVNGATKTVEQYPLVGRLITPQAGNSLESVIKSRDLWAADNGCFKGLDAEAFNSCLDSGRLAGQVAADAAAGNAAGVTGTPALFVNGRFISGAVPVEQITSVVDDELRRHGVKTAEN